MIRPTFYDFPDDPRCFEENDDMMLGGKLLVASVVEPGKQDRPVYSGPRIQDSGLSCTLS